MSQIEKLDLFNIIEINRIRELLEHEPNLLSMFELLVVMGNNRLNDEKLLTSGFKPGDFFQSSDSDDSFIEIESDSDSDDDDVSLRLLGN